MTHPQGQQMPQPAPHGYPQPPAPQPSPRGPSRAKGITAVIFAILAGMLGLAGSGLAGFQISRVVADSNPMTRIYPLQPVAAGLLAVGTVLLLVGAVMHAKRKRAGWVVLLVGVVLSVGSMVPALVQVENLGSPLGAFVTVVTAAVGLLATVLAARSRYWLLPKQPAYPQQPGYQHGYGMYPQAPGDPYGQPGYGQQPQHWHQ